MQDYQPPKEEIYLPGDLPPCERTPLYQPRPLTPQEIESLRNDAKASSKKIKELLQKK